MNEKNKRNIIFGSIFAVLLLPPLIAFAVVYNSVQRTNSFTPAQADIKIVEGNSSGDQLEKDDYTVSLIDGSYCVEKPVEVYDERNKNDEYLRVRFVPTWHDNDGFVCAALPDGISDYSSITVEDNKVLYKNSNGQIILTLCIADDWNSSWKLHTVNSGQLEYFYYDGLIRSDHTTPELITKVEIPSAVYALVKDDYTLKLDVLADAVQQSGSALYVRKWN